MNTTPEEPTMATPDLEDSIALIIEKALKNLEDRGILVPFCDSHDRSDVVECEDGSEACSACYGDGFSGELCHLSCDSVGYELAAKIMKLVAVETESLRKSDAEANAACEEYIDDAVAMGDHLAELRKKLAQYEGILQMSPGGCNKIDELELACEMLRAQNESMAAELAEARKIVGGEAAPARTVTVSEEQVEAACIAWDTKTYWDCRLMVDKATCRDRMRAALTAALSVGDGAGAQFMRLRKAIHDAMVHIAATGAPFTNGKYDKNGEWSFTAMTENGNPEDAKEIKAAFLLLKSVEDQTAEFNAMLDELPPSPVEEGKK